MTEGTALVEIIAPADLAAGNSSPPALFLREAWASERFLDFFTANIQNKHTRRAYYNAACRFSEFCAERGVHDLAHVRPVHVAGYIESLREGFAKPTIKQHLAAIRMLFDWLVVGQIIDVNPAHAVRGPKHVVNKGRTPVLNREEARALLSSIDTSTLTGLRDRALIAVMIYTFARVGAVLQMNVGDYFSQGRRGWVRLHKKGGKEHDGRACRSSKPISTHISGQPASATTRMGHCFAPRGASPGHRIA
jgi:site-specific recombinase XerD